MGKLPLSAVDKAMKLLSFRALSETELRARLLKQGFPSDEVDHAVAECRRCRFIDDAALAEDYTSLLRARNTGSRVIRQKLIKRGLADEITDGILPEEDTSSAEREAALRALEYKWRLLARENDPRKKREKAFRFLISRGFSLDVIRELFDEVDFGGAPDEFYGEY